MAADYRRASLEIYGNIRSAGYTLIRTWLSENFVGSKGSKEWGDLWTMAMSVDLKLSEAANDDGIRYLLSTDDQIEIAMRHLSAHVFEGRTKDRAGATKMRAVIIPGTGADIAPSWLVDSVSSWSKQEHQRDQRVFEEQKRREKKGKGKGKDKDKDKNTG